MFRRLPAKISHVMMMKFQSRFGGREWPVRHVAAGVALLVLGLPIMGKDPDRSPSTRGSERLEGERFPATRKREIYSEDKWNLESTDYALQELYARHGYEFPDPAVRRVFEKFKWFRERLRPGVEALAIQSEFSDVEYENEKALHGNRGGFPAVRKARSAENPPQLRVDVFIAYEYSDIPKPEEGSEKGWDAYFHSRINGVERLSLGLSRPVNDAVGNAQVIEEKIPDSPWKLMVRLGPQKGDRPGTPAMLTFRVSDVRTGEKLEREYDMPDQIESPVDRLQAEDVVISYKFDEIKSPFEESAQKWIERDEGKKVRSVTVSEMDVQIGLESVPLQQSAPGAQPPKPVPPQG